MTFSSLNLVMEVVMNFVFFLRDFFPPNSVKTSSPNSGRIFWVITIFCDKLCALLNSVALDKGDAKSAEPSDDRSAKSFHDSADVTLVYEQELQLQRRTRWFWQL